MKVFRLTKEKYKHDLSGIGAEKAGGRWNNKGTRMIYTAQSRALAMAELAVHLPFGIIPKNYQMLTIDIPENEACNLKRDVLKGKDWKSNPPIEHTQSIGDSFIKKNQCLALKIPSSVVQGEFNYLINPHSKKINKIKIESSEPFSFDERLFKGF